MEVKRHASTAASRIQPRSRESRCFISLAGEGRRRLPRRSPSESRRGRSGSGGGPPAARRSGGHRKVSCDWLRPVSRNISRSGCACNPRMRGRFRNVPETGLPLVRDRAVLRQEIGRPRRETPAACRRIGSSPGRTRKLERAIEQRAVDSRIPRPTRTPASSGEAPQSSGPAKSRVERRLERTTSRERCSQHERRQSPPGFGGPVRGGREPPEAPRLRARAPARGPHHRGGRADPGHRDPGRRRRRRVPLLGGVRGRRGERRHHRAPGGAGWAGWAPATCS